MALGWLLLIFVVAIGVVASIFRPEARARVGWTAAAIVAFIVLYVGVDVARSLAQIRRDRQATERIATNEVQVDDLILAGTSDRHYRMSGLVHNQSPTYTLSQTSGSRLSCSTA